MPFTGGYGTTSFISADATRNGQQSGARSANVVAALWPERCKAMVSVSGYLVGSQEAKRAPLPPQSELAWWYQFYWPGCAVPAGHRICGHRRREELHHDHDRRTPAV